MQKMCLAVAAVLMFAAAAFAQQITGTISGTVTDPSAAVVPGATVHVVNVGTGASRTVTTNEGGRYRVFNLPPGTYTVVVELSGFSPVTRDNITVNINREVTVDAVLEPGPLSEEVTVSGESSTIELEGGAVVGVVTTKQIAELPLNGRNFVQLATLQPGVGISRSTGNSFHAGYGGTNVSIAGARPEMTSFLIEGTNIADVSDKAPSSLAGVLLGVDAVQEFSVQTHGYSAEYGRAAGGVVSAVTKSGTNVLHGTAFGFYRDSKMDAQNYFDQGDEPPPFQRRQFGASLGGPILKDRLFFFANYEGLRQELAVTNRARLPNESARNGFLPDGAGGLTFVGVHPTVRPYLDLLFPVPDGQDFGDGTAELVHAVEDPVNENFGVAKVDWQLSQQDSMFVRFSADTSSAINTLSNPLFEDQTDTNTRYFTTQYQRLFGANVVNVLRGAINRTQRAADTVPLVDVPPSLYYTTVPYLGGITIAGMTGVPGGSPAEYAQTLFQLGDSLTWSTRRHTMKFGFDVQRTRFEPYSYPSYGGAFRFRNLREFLTLRRSGTAAADRFTGSLPGSDTRRDITQSYVALFAQDEFSLSDRLTLSYGLRYEFVTTPDESQDRVAGLLSLDDLESGPQGVTPGTPIFDPPRPWVVPRVGLAWDPFGNQRTSVRGGFGLFTQPLTTSYYRGTVSRIFPYYAGVNIRLPSVFGPGVQQLLDEGTGLSVVKRSEFVMFDAEQPHTWQYNLNVQHELATGIVAEIGYLGSRGYNLPFYGDPNSVPAEQAADGRWRTIPGAGLRYPSWGRIRTKKNVAESSYHGVTVGLNRRFSAGLLLQGAYTLAKSTDDWSGGLLGNDDFEGAAGSATNWWCVECEHGPSNFDVRHTFVFNAVYQLPFGRDQAGVAGALARGWQVGVIVNLASGHPFTPYIGWDRAGDQQTDTGGQKPDYAPGYSGDPIAGSPDQWFDPEAFVLPPAGSYGNVGRNILTGPDLRTVDFSILKDVRLGRTSLQFRAEVFNLLNRANFGNPDSEELFNPDGTRRPGVGRITRTTTTARQVQLGIKLLF